jgi:colanic acid/amylovoran biosynthesis protein
MLTKTSRREPNFGKSKSIRTLIRHIFGVFYKTRIVKIITEIEVILVLAILKLDVNDRSSKKIGQDALILTAPDGGNIGDRMMLLSVLNRIKKRCSVISEDSKAITLLTGDHQPPEMIQIRNLYHGKPGFHLPVLLKFARLAKHSGIVLMIGADLMDGKYNYIASLHRLQLLHLTNKMRIQTAVLGFSWGEEIANSLISYMKNNCGLTQFYARDPISKLRLDNLGVKNVIQSSDLVFSLSFTTHNASAVYKLKLPRYCVINGSGLISNSPEIKKIYSEVIKNLVDKDFNVILIPHVIRDSDNDLVVLSSIYEEFCDSSHVVLIEKLLSPKEIFEYCEGASLVLTSRMHLAILALLSGTPPVTFASNGKVEGLLKMFELEGICVSNDLAYSDVFSRLIENYFCEFAEMKFRISNKLPDIIKLSLINFD